MGNIHDNSAAGQGPVDLEKIKELHEQLQKDIESSQKSNDTEDRFDTLAYDTLSMIFARFFIKQGISANTVTLLSLVLGVLGSLFFYPRIVGINFIGVVIEYFAVVLDCADGQVARMTHTSSQLGRFLDGLVDSLNFAAIYIVLGLRMMNETVPFTSVKWGAFIWIIILINGYVHGEQARMADYYRGLHLSFIDHGDRANFTSSKRIKEELAESKDTPLYNRIYLFTYYLYTKAQERLAPNAQKLLGAIEENGVISAELSEAYISRSRKYIQLTNVLTFNLRAYVLYLLILLKLHPFFFLFNLIVLSGIMFYMISRYEKIAAEVYGMFFAGRKTD